MVPSKIPSTKPEMVVMGVLRSWETLAMKEARICSFLSSESAMLLKAMASSAISSSPTTRTRTSKCPCPKRRAA